MNGERCAGDGMVLEVSDDREEAAPILASDAERECSIVLLRDAVGEGRLTLEEFSQRVDLAQAARTDGELAAHPRPASQAHHRLPRAQLPSNTVPSART